MVLQIAQQLLDLPWQPLFLLFSFFTSSSTASTSISITSSSLYCSLLLEGTMNAFSLTLHMMSVVVVLLLVLLLMFNCLGFLPGS